MNSQLGRARLYPQGCDKERQMLSCDFEVNVTQEGGTGEQMLLTVNPSPPPSIPFSRTPLAICSSSARGVGVEGRPASPGEGPDLRKPCGGRRA